MNISRSDDQAALLLLQHAVSVAHRATAPTDVLAEFSELLVRAAGTEDVHIYLYDNARRLLRHGVGAANDTSNRLLVYWPAIRRVVALSQPLIENGSAIVPLLANHKVIGVVLVLGTLVDEQQPLLFALVQLLAAALDVIELRAALARQQYENTRLVAVQQALLGSQSIEDIAEHTAEAVGQLCGAARSMIFLDDQDGWLRPVARRHGAVVQHTAVLLEGSRMGMAIRAMQPLVFTISTEQWNLPPSNQMPDSIDLLAAPLWFDNQAIGVLTTMGKRNSFTPQHVHTIGVFADHLALAVSRVRRSELQRTAQPAVQLTKREVEVLGQIAQGRSNQEIARSLAISDRTVSTHLSNILGKLKLSSRTQAVLYALHHNLVNRSY